MSLDSYEVDEGDTQPHLKTGTGGIYKQGLQPAKVLADLLSAIPELGLFADIDVQVIFNRDSSRFGPMVSEHTFWSSPASRSTVEQNRVYYYRVNRSGSSSERHCTPPETPMTPF